MIWNSSIFQKLNLKKLSLLCLMWSTQIFSSVAVSVEGDSVDSQRLPAAYVGPSPLEILPVQFLTSSSPKDGKSGWNQNWSPADRLEFYFRPQGSWMIPLEYAEVLTNDKNQKFFTSENLKKYGFIPQKDDKARGKKSLNPLGLPVGFAIDGGQTFSINPLKKGAVDYGKRYVGITCAACHTSNLRVFNEGKETLVRIDGGQAHIDFQQFVFDMDKAIIEKADNPDAFIALLRGASQQSKEVRLSEFLRFVEERKEWQRLNGWGIPGGSSKLDGFVWGAGRNDAFGVILNQVLVTAFEKPENFYGRKADGTPLLGKNGKPVEYRPEAPVSYPVMWDAHQHSHVQWNGLASNGPPGPIGRNVGEVLGVFGKVDIFKKTALTNGFCSTARRDDLIQLEDKVRTLWSPKWDEKIFGTIDRKLAAEGSKIYDSKCLNCHKIMKRTGDPSSTEIYATGIGEKLIDMESIKTDTKMNLAVVSRLSKVPSQIIGRKLKLKHGYDLAKVEPAGLVLKHVVASALAGSISILSCENTDMTTGQAITKWYEVISMIRAESKNQTTIKAPPIAENHEAAEQALAEAEQEEADSVRKVQEASTNRPMTLAEKQKQLTEELGKYKARPLNGIWSSAPFLHNGSVASLWDLLQPAHQRHLDLPISEDVNDSKHKGKVARTKLKVGCDVFDPVKVGLDCQTKWGDSETRYIEKEIDLTLYGNRPVGHAAGTDLSHPQKLQLLEFLKTL